MKFKKAFITELHAAPYNPRKDLQPSDPEYQQIKRSIEEFGYVDPIIVNSDYTVIGGHQRLKVMKELGHAQIDVVVVDIPKNKEKALNVALNKISGEWDTQRLTELLGELKTEGLLDLTGFDIKELDGMLRELHKDDEPMDSEPQISRAEELRKEWGTELGQMWQCGDHRVICGDCTDPAVVGRVMQGEKADMVFTDPPYNVNYGDSTNPRYTAHISGKHKLIEGDNLSKESWISFNKTLINIIKSNNNGDIYIWGAPGPDGMRSRLTYIDEGCHWSATIIWKKNRLVLAAGKYQRMYEPCFYGWFNKSSFVGDRTNVEVWEVDRPTISELHPTMKPVELCCRGIANSSINGATVLDPFLGSGTTMIACENLGRKCRGCEIDPGYVAVILQRYKDTFPNKEIKLIE